MGVGRRSLVAFAGPIALSGCLNTVVITDGVRDEAIDRTGSKVEDQTGFGVEVFDDPLAADDQEWYLYEFRVENEEDGPGVFHRSVTEIDETIVHESCLTSELAFPSFVAYHDDETGETPLEMELIEHRAGG
jgi:hypothetical protein